jgi:hypothetical protein
LLLLEPRYGYTFCPAQKSLKLKGGTIFGQCHETFLVSMPTAHFCDRCFFDSVNAYQNWREIKISTVFQPTHRNGLYFSYSTFFCRVQFAIQFYQVFQDVTFVVHKVKFSKVTPFPVDFSAQFSSSSIDMTAFFIRLEEEDIGNLN